MRFLHTADWHLGKTLRGQSRLDEQQRALAQIADAAVGEQVDAVLIAGDVYESTMPPAEAEAMVYEFLARLSQQRIPVVLIAGNHDHPRKLAALRDLLEGLRIHVRANVQRPDEGGVIELTSRDGSERARVAALPFVPERKIVDALQVVQGDDRGHQAYSDRLATVIGQMAASFAADTVNLLVAHVLVSGARFGTGERQLHLGEIFALRPESLPVTAQYAALGHLHRPQEIPAPCRAAYAGSLIELDFGEREQDKRAVLVEARVGQPARLRDVPITAGRRLRDLDGTLAELERQQPDVADAFLRVTVRVPEPTPGVEERVRALLPNAVDVRQEWPRSPAERAARPRRALSPQELFAMYYERRHETAPPDALMALFGTVHGEAAAAPEEDGAQ